MHLKGSTRNCDGQQSRSCAKLNVVNFLVCIACKLSTHSIEKDEYLKINEFFIIIIKIIIVPSATIDTTSPIWPKIR